MRLDEQIRRIQNLIMELSPKEPGVQEFMDYVQSFPEIIGHLQFENFKSFKEYLLDCSYEEFHELVREAQQFVERRKKYLEDELQEFERVVQYLNREENIDISVSELIDLFEKSREITIPQIVWDRLENTECNQIKKGEMKKVIELAKKYNKSNPKDLKKALTSGDYRRPLILKFGDRFHLIAGNTRLCTAAALGIKPKVLIADLDILSM